MISWLLALLASSQVPYELLALVISLFTNTRESPHIYLPITTNQISLTH